MNSSTWLRLFWYIDGFFQTSHLFLLNLSIISVLMNIFGSAKEKPAVQILILQKT